MLTKILQAYRTAWYYPKAVGNSKTSTVIDRFLFIGIPLMIAITAFISADRYMDTLSAFIISFVIMMIANTLTIATTRTEVEMVNLYLAKHHLPPISTLNSNELDHYTQVAYEFVKTTGNASCPILSEDTGSWIGFGHTLPEDFVNLVLETSHSEIENALRYELEDSVRFGYAVTYTMKDDPDLYLRECPRDTPNAFPVTILPATADLPEITTDTDTLAKIPEDQKENFRPTKKSTP